MGIGLILLYKLYMFSVYQGTFSTACLQNLIWTCSIVLLSNCLLYDNNSGPDISQTYRTIGFTKESKSLRFISTVGESMLKSNLLIVDKT